MITSLWFSISIYDKAPVLIGERTTVLPDVCICTTTNNLQDIASVRDKSRDFNSSFAARPIIIQEDCWIGTGATILAGVTIGRRATVLNGAVVIEDVPAEAIVRGVPAKEVTNFEDGESPEPQSIGPDMYGVSESEGAVDPKVMFQQLPFSPLPLSPSALKYLSSAWLEMHDVPESERDNDFDKTYWQHPDSSLPSRICEPNSFPWHTMLGDPGRESAAASDTESGECSLFPSLLPFNFEDPTPP